MHYKNGREAKNGDKVAIVRPAAFDNSGQPTKFEIAAVGILYDATAGNDFCNGKIAVTSPNDPCPNLQECLHVDDVVQAVADSEKCASKK